jgi:coenzyme F420-reducing hydrogenase delta subunit
MTAAFLAEIEAELAEVADDIDFSDEDYAFNREIDALRAIVRKIGVESERLKLAAVKAA